MRLLKELGFGVAVETYLSVNAGQSHTGKNGRLFRTKVYPGHFENHPQGLNKR